MRRQCPILEWWGWSGVSILGKLWWLWLCSSMHIYHFLLFPSSTEFSSHVWVPMSLFACNDQLEQRVTNFSRISNFLSFLFKESKMYLVYLVMVVVGNNVDIIYGWSLVGWGLKKSCNWPRGLMGTLFKEFAGFYLWKLRTLEVGHIYMVPKLGKMRKNQY